MHFKGFVSSATAGEFVRKLYTSIRTCEASLFVWPRGLPFEVNPDGFLASFSSRSKINSGWSGMQPRLLISLLNRMKAKEKSEREIGGQVKVFPYNFLYSSENFPPQIPVTFTVQLEPLLVRILLLRNSMNFFVSTDHVLQILLCPYANSDRLLYGRCNKI